MSLCGTGKDHCCYFKGQPCQYVVAINKPPFNWACSLRVELGHWYVVYADPRYINNVKPLLKNCGLNYDCGDYPLAGQRCGDCGEVG